uniref:Uncharacterized protein n=1 Tax=Chromulina nebulosa TaxID=96789 RepID=A0A7S0XBN5_9STRA|mmetsp:Transcript_2165/g.1937  ORF Transcript_2165/g.1937 Transcript_2165/m.1937 type:complete len:301 (+) Transcript_2165:73-975(+)
MDTNTSKLPIATEIPVNQQISDTITLEVAIPDNVEVGSTVNVLYEGNYYQILVPENAPGKSIQVVLPNIPIIDANTSTEELELEYNTENKKSSNRSYAVAAGVAGAVIGTILVGPLVTGAVVIGGAAVYAASRKKNNDDSTEDNGIIGKATHKVHEIDSKYEISATATKVVNAGVVKAKEIDDKMKISETLTTVSATITSKVKETDEKFGITTKTNEVLTSTATAVKNFDERNKITETATHIAQDAAVKAKDIDSKYEISANVTKAFTLGANAITASVSKLTESVSKVTTKPTHHDSDNL